MWRMAIGRGGMVGDGSDGGDGGGLGEEMGDERMMEWKRRKRR